MNRRGRIADAREVGRRNARAAVRGTHSEVVPVERLANFGGHVSRKPAGQA
jgi:hypothetical protein